MMDTITAKQQRQLENLSLALQEKEVENKRLKQALRLLQASRNEKTALFPHLTEQLDAARVELSSTRLQLERQTETAVGLRYQILEQQDEIRTLKDRQRQFIRKIVELEIDLETHDVHFSRAAEQVKELEGLALQETIRDPNLFLSQKPSDRSNPRRALDYIAKLTSDYSLLEFRYKRSAEENARKQLMLEQQNQSLQAGLMVLEERFASTDKSVKFSLNESSKKNACRRRINDLECQNAKLVLQHEQMKIRLDEAESSLANVPCSKSSAMGGDTVVALQEELAVKDQKMALLRTLAINYQVRNFLATNDDVARADPNTMLLVQGDNNDARGYSDGEAASYYVCPSDDDDCDILSSVSVDRLQTAVQDLNEILVRKDRELELQKKDFEAKERELLAQLDAACGASIHETKPERARFFI